LRDGEALVVEVTPLPRDVARPLAATLLAVGALWGAATLWTWASRHEAYLSVIVVVPAAVLGQRLWRWWSHRVVVTTQRIIDVRGRGGRRLTAIELAEVRETTVDQRAFDRLLRRGSVILALDDSACLIGRVRRPDALRRVIDHVRSTVPGDAGDRPAREGSDPALEEGLLTDDDDDQRWRHLFGPDGPRG